MKALIYTPAFALAIFLSSCQNTHSIYIVRHAEKSTEPANDPPLTNAGKIRAEALKDFLRGKNVSAVYSTKTTRTIETASPFSSISHIPVQYYGNDTLPQFLQMAFNLKKNVLIVAHSNTTVTMLQQLKLPHSISYIPDNDYDNMFIIETRKGKPVKIIETTYGPVSPVK